MKKALLAGCLLLHLVCQAQVNGRVLDSATRQPLVFATVRLMTEKQKAAGSIITDSSGRYAFQNVHPGNYFFVFSMAGYAVKHSALLAVNGPLAMEDQTLTTLTKTLTSVTVVAQRPLVTPRIDGFTYDATQDVPVPGENSSDLLRKLPGVQVDPDGIPSMRGSTRIKVFIDGKPSEAYASSIVEALRQIPADNIAKIEIITQPSARYDAEGVDGVINIFTKRRLSDGSSGAVNGYYQNRVRQLNTNIAWRRKQWILTAEAGYNYSNNISWTTIDRADIANNRVSQYQVRANQFTNLSGSIGITWLADSLTTISIGYRYGQGKDHITTDIDYYLANNQFRRSIDNPYKRWIHPLTWSYIRRSKDKTGEFSLLAYWFDHHIESDYSLRQNSYKENNVNTTWNKELNLEANYVKGNFETGIKSSFRRYRSASIFTPDNNRSQDFTFPRDIYAGYANYMFQIKEWKLRLGLRYEHTVLSLDFPDTSIRVPDYKNLLPNLLLSRNFGAHTFTAGYSRKIFRPYLAYLSPVINYVDSLNISYGNPYLDPAVSNNYDLTYSFIKNKWMISLNSFLYQTLRSIEAIALLKSSGIVERTYLNIARNTISGVAIQLTYRTSKFTFNTNNTLRYIDYGQREGWTGNFGGYAIYKLTSTFSVSAFLSYNTTRVDLQGSTTGSRYYNFGASKTFRDGKYGLSIRLDNLFMPFQTITETNETENFITSSANRQIRRFFRLGFSYKFGKKEIRVPATRTASSDQ
jgi:outer membrane receptor for ferrienterochelin and colicin